MVLFFVVLGGAVSVIRAGRGLDVAPFAAAWAGPTRSKLPAPMQAVLEVHRALHFHGNKDLQAIKRKEDELKRQLQVRGHLSSSCRAPSCVRAHRAGCRVRTFQTGAHPFAALHSACRRPPLREQDLQRELQQTRSQRELTTEEARQLAALNDQLAADKQALEAQRAGLEAANEELARRAEGLAERQAALERSEESLRQENANLLQQVFSTGPALAAVCMKRQSIGALRRGPLHNYLAAHLSPSALPILQFDRLKIKYEEESASFHEQLAELKQQVGAGQGWGGRAKRVFRSLLCTKALYHRHVPCFITLCIYSLCTHSRPPACPQVSGALQRFAAGELSAEALLAFLAAMGMEVRCLPDELERLPDQLNSARSAEERMQ